MDFKTYFFSLPIPERDSFAAAAGTTRGLLTQVAYRNKAVELGLADVLCALSKGAVTLDDVRLTENAQRQRRIRESALPASRRGPKASIAKPAKAEAARIAALEAELAEARRAA